MSMLTGCKWVEAFVELSAPKRVRGACRGTESPAPLEEGAAGQLLGLDVEGSGPRKIRSPEAQMASLGPDMMGVGEVIEEMLGNTEDGPEHKGTGAVSDELMEETLGGTEDGPKDDGSEWVTMVEHMVWKAWMNWEQSLREVHWHQ